MFRFENPIFLYLLLLIPLLALVRYLYQRDRKAKIKRFGDPDLLQTMMNGVSKYRPAVKFWLLEAALALFIVMMARPQFGSRIHREKRQGIEAMICMDISNSMLAEDVVPSRLDKSKMLMENLVDHFDSDKVGLVVYAGDAFVQMPITADYVSAKMFMQNINPSLIAAQGTDIATAIDLAMKSFTQDEKAGKAIILITDGEDHEGQAMAAAQAAKEKGIKVFILGIGTSKGAPIPMPDGHYLTDRSGETVMTRLNEDMCKEIAAAGSGTYIHVDNTSNAQEMLDDEILKMQKGEVSTVVYSDYDEQFQAVGIIALLLLIIETVVLERRRDWQNRIKLFRRGTAAALLLVVATAASAQTDRQYVRMGNQLYRQGKFDKAELEYKKALSKNENNPQALYNMGLVALQQQKDSDAVACFNKAAKVEKNPLRRAMAYHNIGVIMQTHQDYGQAIEAYKEALRNNPKDNETRYNLALCQRQKKDNKGGGGQNQQNQDKQDQNKDKQKDQQDKKQDQQQNQQQQQQPRNNQMSKENAERLLDAAVQQEKNTQQRLQKAMQQSPRRSLDKNW